MQIEIKIDHSCKEAKVIVVTDKITDEINALVKKLAQDTPQLLAGLQGDTLKILDQPDIIRLYATNGKVYAETEDGGSISFDCGYMNSRNALTKTTLSVFLTRKLSI